MLLFGGNDGKLCCDLFVLDLKCMHWYSVDPPGSKPLPVSAHTATEFGDHVVVFGQKEPDSTISYSEISVLHVGTPVVGVSRSGPPDLEWESIVTKGRKPYVF